MRWCISPNNPWNLHNAISADRIYREREETAGYSYARFDEGTKCQYLLLFLDLPYLEELRLNISVQDG